jgi:hypothetical protein
MRRNCFGHVLDIASKDSLLDRKECQLQYDMYESNMSEPIAAKSRPEIIP